jgi:hypothetical protein
LACSPGWAQTFTADTPVLAAPEVAAKVVGDAKGGTAVKVVRRQGFWLEVEAGSIKGWVKISAVKLATPTGPTSIDTGRLGGGNIVASSAARGLSAEDLINGRSDDTAVDRLGAVRADALQIAQFAKEGGLGEVRLAVFLKGQATAAEAPVTPAIERSEVSSGGRGAEPAPAPAPSSSRARRRRAADEDM